MRLYVQLHKREHVKESLFYANDLRSQHYLTFKKKINNHSAAGLSLLWCIFSAEMYFFFFSHNCYNYLSLLNSLFQIKEPIIPLGCIFNTDTN